MLEIIHIIRSLLASRSELLYLSDEAASDNYLCNLPYLMRLHQIITSAIYLMTLHQIYPEWPHRQGICLALLVDSPLILHRFLLCSRRSGITAYESGGCDQSIGSTFSDAIVRSWLWSTATRSSPLGSLS